jgi:hypothetical protein
VADAAGFNLDADLATAGLRNWTLDKFEISTGFGNLNGFHKRPSFE